MTVSVIDANIYFYVMMCLGRSRSVVMGGMKGSILQTWITCYRSYT